jgi:hypothetical protein
LRKIKHVSFATSDELIETKVLLLKKLLKTQFIKEVEKKFYAPDEL